MALPSQRLGTRRAWPRETAEPELGGLLELAESDPRRCVDECQRVIRSDSEPVAKAEAYRAQGIALRDLGRIEESISSLKAAREEFTALSLNREADESAISLAASVAISGDFKKALSMLEPICGHPDSTVRSHALVQRAGLVARSGGFDESLRLYEEAEPTLAANEDLRWLALMYSTRGLVQTYRSEFDAAESDLRSAKQLFESMDRHSSAAEMLGNLGFLFIVRGDIAHGLETLLETLDLCVKWGVPTEPVRTAQAFGYMLAGMPDRAYQVLESAARHLEKQGRKILQAEALIQAARAALSAERIDAAINAVDRAQAIPSLGEREGWAAMAELVRADATIAASGSADADRLQALAHRFLKWENLTGAAHALTLAASVDLDKGHISPAASKIAEASAIDESLIELPVRVRIGLIRARSSVMSGEDSDALAMLQETADLIDRQRILLGATESRAGLSRLSDRVAEMGLSLLPEGIPSVEWIDRFRASSLRMIPVVPNRNPEIARLMGELRRMSKERDENVAGGHGAPQLTADIQELESRIRDLALTKPEMSSMASPLTVSEAREALGSRHLFYLYPREGVLFGSLIDRADASTEAIGDGSQLQSISHHVLSAMRRSFLYPRRSSPERVLAGIDELSQILDPLRDVMGEVVVVPPPDLIGLPWNAMAGSAAPETTVVTAPSASAWARADRKARETGSVCVVAGPRLPHADSEVRSVSRVYGDDVEVLSGERSTVDLALRAMESSSTFHAVAHGHLRWDNPMFSSIELGDGHMNLYNLEEVNNAPATVVLSACDSAHGSVVSGLEMFGLSSVLLGRGSRSILSTVAPIPDSLASVEAVGRIHEGLRDGVGPARALQVAQADAASEAVDPSLAFVAYGAS